MPLLKSHKSKNRRVIPILSSRKSDGRTGERTQLHLCVEYPVLTTATFRKSSTAENDTATETKIIYFVSNVANVALNYKLFGKTLSSFYEGMHSESIK